MKKVVAVFLVTMMSAILVVPCFAVTGSGSSYDPFVLPSDGFQAVGRVTYPIYFRSTAQFCRFRSTGACFTADTDYYLYTPVQIDSTEGMKTYNSSYSLVANVTYELVYDDGDSEGDWFIYKFSSSADGYGLSFKHAVSSDPIDFYLDSSYHEPGDYMQLTQDFFATFLSVGGSFVSFVTGNWITLVVFTLIVIIFGVGVIRRLVKGV